MPITKLTFVSDMRILVYGKMNVGHNIIHIQRTKMTYS